MKAVVVLLSVLFVVADAGAQTSAQAEGPPDLQMVKYSWSKERIGWERDPFAAPVEDFNDMRGRVSRERRTPTALEERSAGAEKTAKTRPAPPPRYAFNYRLSVQNAGSKTIKQIDWDYVFTDTTTGEELGRRKFTSAEKINPGKRKEFTVFAYSPPAKRISVYSLGKREREGLVERVIVVRIHYDDGSVWQAR